jgi:hypothetical protein
VVPIEEQCTAGWYELSLAGLLLADFTGSILRRRLGRVQQCQRVFYGLRAPSLD